MAGFYFDEHMNRAVSDGLIKRGHQVIMAVDVDMQGKDDDTEHLPYAAKHNLILVTFDHPFAGRDHTRLICLAYTLRENVGRTIEILAEFAELYNSEQDMGKVFWLS